MIDRINNTICFLIVAATFAMIGIEAGAHHSPTHSGTQQVCPIHPSIHSDCQK